MCEVMAVQDAPDVPFSGRQCRSAANAAICSYLLDGADLLGIQSVDTAQACEGGRAGQRARGSRTASSALDAHSAPHSGRHDRTVRRCNLR